VQPQSLELKVLVTAYVLGVAIHVAEQSRWLLSEELLACWVFCRHALDAAVEGIHQGQQQHQDKMGKETEGKEQDKQQQQLIKDQQCGHSAGVVLQAMAAEEAAAASREAMLAAENRDLVARLAATHQKLKLLRSRSEQREAVQKAQVGVYAHVKAYSAKRACADTGVHGLFACTHVHRIMPFCAAGMRASDATSKLYAVKQLSFTDLQRNR